MACLVSLDSHQVCHSLQKQNDNLAIFFLLIKLFQAFFIVYMVQTQGVGWGQHSLCLLGKCPTLSVLISVYALNMWGGVQGLAAPKS